MQFIVVYGPPCSGKTTYVQKNKGKKDIIIDFDRLRTALTFSEIHSTNDEKFANRYVNACRGSIVSCAKKKQGEAETYWYTTSILTDSLKEWFSGLNPEYREIEATEEECLEHLANDDTRPDKEYWTKIIKNWFKEFKNTEGKKMTPDSKFKFKTQAQSRTMILTPTAEGEKKFDSRCYVEGYAARYEKYLLFDFGEDGKVYERFEPGCFVETDMSDVIFQFDHEGRVFARTTNNTLYVAADSEGLKMAADLDKTDRARDLYADIDSKMITKMSWRFRTGDYHIERTEGSKDITIVHTKIPKIYDVSAVSIPANDNTEINARDFVSGVRDEVARRDAELDDKRKKIKLKIKLMEVI